MHLRGPWCASRSRGFVFGITLAIIAGSRAFPFLYFQF
jgi:hypothetical protein